MIWPLFRFEGRNPGKNFIGILVQTMTPKGHFEINWPLAAWTLLLWVINLQQVTGKQNSTQCRIMYCCLCLTGVAMILEFPTLNIWEIYCRQQIANYCIYILYINRTTKIKPFYLCMKNWSLGFWSKYWVLNNQNEINWPLFTTYK